MKIKYGIILMGGRSSRMGTDKSMIQIDNQFLYEIAIEKLLPFCANICLSINESQSNLSSSYPVMVDKYKDSGPIGGILSCFERDMCPMIVLAPDLVNIHTNTIKNLIEIHNNNEQTCTVYYNSVQKIYEPMLSIWEKPALQQLQIYYEHNSRSLQKFLNKINTPHHSIQMTEQFININTIQEREAWLQSR